MSHDDQWRLFSEVRPVRSVAEAEFLWQRWLREIGPEVIQFWRSSGWIPIRDLPERILNMAKTLKLQDRKIRVSSFRLSLSTYIILNVILLNVVN